jgi:SAM-dependent methyltransferase
MVFDSIMPNARSVASRQNPALVQEFLHNVRGAIPLTIEQIDMMLRLLVAAREKVHTFLDLGCGDGFLAAAILDEHPEARGYLIDDSEPMLQIARRHLDGYGDRVEFILADFNEPGWAARVARGVPFDAIVSAFAIHHSPEERKRPLYGQIFDLLQPGGLFINIEHVASATRWTESVWDDYTIDAIFGEQLRASPGKSRAEVAREYYANASRAPHAQAPLEVQCDWLREIGFENVDCFLKVLELAVFGGQRPA